MSKEKKSSPEEGNMVGGLAVLIFLVWLFWGDSDREEWEENKLTITYNVDEELWSENIYGAERLLEDFDGITDDEDLNALRRKIREKKLQVAAEKKNKGFHCLSGWDGSHPEVKSYVERQLVNTSSFEHIETRITPVDDKGIHELAMQYKGANILGELVSGIAIATISNQTCSATNISIQ